METGLQRTQFTEALEKAKKDHYNLLMPTMHIEGLSEFHQPVLETVTMSPNPADGDVYPHDDEKDEKKKKWRLTKQALMKLSVCGGVIWSVSGSKRIDDGSNRNYIAYQAVGGIKKADGSPVFFKASYDMDFEVIEEELREQYTKKAKYFKDKTDSEKVEYIDYCVKRDLLQKRKHGLKLCESGAMNRVLREIFSLKQVYTADELSKPFVMARIVFRPDYNDKDVRKAILDAHIKQMTGLYGDVSDRFTQDQADAAIDVTERGKETEQPEPGNGNPPPTEEPPAGAGGPPPEKEVKLADYEAGERRDKEAAVVALAKRKGYGLDDWLKKAKLNSPADVSPGRLLEFFKYLLGLPDKADQDTPF